MILPEVLGMLQDAVEVLLQKRHRGGVARSQLSKVQLYPQLFKDKGVSRTGSAAEHFFSIPEAQDSIASSSKKMERGTVQIIRLPYSVLPMTKLSAGPCAMTGPLGHNRWVYQVNTPPL